MPAEEFYVGLMSGTSMDGIDAALADFSQSTPRLIAHHHQPYPDELRNQLIALCQPGENEIDRLGEADIQVAQAFADATLKLLERSDISPTVVRAIGSHGQTLRHRPTFKHPFTLQIGDPNTLSQRTGITTVADFRRRDMAVQGQGAPLAPAFHKQLFLHPQINRVILNIGGIANITWLSADPESQILGFDTGPGNTLLDHWIRTQRSMDYDSDGDWAASGKVIHELLACFHSDPFFEQPPPKSTGTDYFNLDWLSARSATHSYAPQDVQATLAELTARSIATAITQYCSTADELLVCGGGVHNSDLMTRLATQLPELKVSSSMRLGVDPDWIEAMAFAWLAKRTLEGKLGNLPATTGAEEAVILGGIYPANPTDR
ncbi:MAG: anhydro-N-acetylmuramic acid kinase [Pseudomonadota bacterium]